MKRPIFMITVMGVLLLICSPCISMEYYFNEAAEFYELSPVLLSAIAKTESNYNFHAINRNGNGTYDICHMQINSSWEKVLKDNWPYVAQSPYYCTMFGAWVLRMCVERYGYDWNAVACYNIGSSPEDAPSQELKNIGASYIGKVKKALIDIDKNRP
jgi:soluble lytic murein transglycosylase-like protein